MRMQMRHWGGMLLPLLALVGFTMGEAAEPNPPAPLYWCPHRNLDQQYKTVPEPGCVPLVEEKKADQKERVERKIKIENIQSEASAFLQRYRRYLDCCATDPDTLEDLEDLEEYASDLLRAIQQTGLANMSTSQRGFTLSAIISPVAQARSDLRTLKKRLEQISVSKDKIETLDFEAAGRERLRIRESEESVKREFRPTRPADSAPTGTEIQDTTVPNRFGTTFGDTTLPNATGTDIGTVVSPGSDQQTDLRPRRGLDTGHHPS